MARFLQNIPETVSQLINEYASDKVGTHPSASLIKRLYFRLSRPGEFRRDGYQSTVVETRVPEYFIKPPTMAGWLRQPDLIRFIHGQFDERNFPQHFDVRLTWENLRKQDEIEAMGKEDLRLYPEGMPAAVEPQHTLAVQPLQWTRTGEGKWVSH